MKVKALTNGFMRTKGEWYTVREELESCYIIESGKMLICVLKRDFITEKDFRKVEAKRQVLNLVYSYEDTDGLKANFVAIDIKKVNALNVDLKNLLYALLEEVKA